MGDKLRVWLATGAIIAMVTLVTGFSVIEIGRINETTRMQSKLNPTRVQTIGAIAATESATTTRGQSLGAEADAMALDLTGGDPVAGQNKYVELGCVACHLLSISPAPDNPVSQNTRGTYTRIVTYRLTKPENQNKTAEQYIAESILRPNAYVVPGYAPNVMPQDYGNRLTLQDLRDLIAYLNTQR